MYKKNGKLRVFIDFRDLNKATPMDGYPMPIADMLVDAAARNKVISFMDGNAYILEMLGEEEEFHRAINGKYLKKYYPSV